MPSLAAFGNQLYTGERSLDFMGRRKLWYAISGVLVIICLIGFGVRGLTLGIDFRGGTEFQLSEVADQDTLKAEGVVQEIVSGSEVRTTKVGDSSLRIETDKLSDSDLQKVQTALAEAYDVDSAKITTNYVGPSWGQDVTSKALRSLLIFLVAVGLMMALYFRTWSMALAGLGALVHDLVLTAGVYALVGWEVTPASVIGFLTILGYSLYDTVVVFDKVRENTEHVLGSTKRTFTEAANLALNQTLVRSLNTSVVALLPVAAILFIGAFVLGAGTLKDISLALFVGIIAGTYSSVFIATPLVVDLRRRDPALREHAAKVERKRAEAAEHVDDEPETVGAAPVLREPSGGQRSQPRRGAKGRR